MRTVNIFEAKTNFSRLVEAIETGAEAEIVSARNGRPVARLVPVAVAPASRRLGVARGAFVVPDSLDAATEEIERLFYGSKA